MTAKEKEVITILRKANYSFNYIGEKLGRSVNTVKSFCRRNGVKPECKRKTKAEKAATVLCLNCKKPLGLNKKSNAKFCSDYCRNAYRRSHLKVTEK